ncbi:MAG: hypothetical protein CL946_00720 [Ectothiorhodospiraceae bacterium]|nr:hypothetical protein [Ectothiorhodospiraceae bacterium]
MTQTPYQPPVTVGAQAPSLIAPYHYRSPRGLANWLTGALLAQAVSWGAMGTIDIVATLWVPGYSADEFAETGLALVCDLMLIASLLVMLLTYAASIVLFLTWMYRACANAHALRSDRLRFTPGWTVAYWFIPILNLFRPYQVMCEIYRASKPGSSETWNSSKLPGYMIAWWMCWIVGNILGRLEMRAELGSVDLGGAALPLGITTTLLGTVAAILAVVVVRAVTSRQVIRAQELGAGRAH